MKKFFLLVVAVLLVVQITGCGNMSLGMGNYSYKKIHVDTYHYSGCLTVEQWYENDNGVEVMTKEAGPMFLSEGTYIMLSGDKPCPFCSEE